MQYQLEYRDAAIEDLDRLPRNIARLILKKLDRLRQGLVGDIKRLTNFKPRYRLRIGDYRALFEIEGSRIIIWRIRHRSKVYDQ